ncbi:MAG: hypothetical protein WAK84_04525 [Candidatus Cybelea sp.]
MKKRAPAWLLALGLAGCAGMMPFVPSVPGGSTAPNSRVVDASSSACEVSYEGVVWYALPARSFSPIDYLRTRCNSAALSANPNPPRPAWAIPNGPTQTRFVATSYQQAYSLAGMRSIEGSAVAADLPESWMISNFKYLTDDTPLYNSYHEKNGDDVEAQDYGPLIKEMKSRFSWYVPEVSVEGAGHERRIAHLISRGYHAFWGITWNSHGTDGTWDYGAPWGSYCSDPSSYKRPDRNGGCTLLALEWTARDLTRAYLSGDEADFSTDPDDLQQRGGFTPQTGATYIREIADAYAAIGQTQPVVMMSQQESHDETNPGDPQILGALYDQAVHDRMKVETLAQVAADGRTFSVAPRAAAFPFIPGGVAVPSSILNGQTLYPATIDYHDKIAGMSFLAGHTLPTRVFEYAEDPTSYYNVPLVSFPPSDFPTLTGAVVHHGTLSIALSAPVTMHIGIAIWANPRTLGITAPGAIPAGRAGEVIVFDVKAGPNQFSFACPGCKSATFTYST